MAARDTAMPSGTVTFLFTDMERSSPAWERDEWAMAVAQARHDEILWAAIAAAHGYVFSTGGDGLAAVFPRAQDALRAAVEAQRALTEERWPEGTNVTVRMGLHTGEAIERDGNYFGAAVIRAARLMSVVSGGRIACSQTTQQVLRPHLRDGLTLVAIGTVRLRGLADLEQVFAVAGPGLAETGEAVEDSLRPSEVSNHHRHNLPVAVTRFVGRSTELAELTELLGRTRLVTLTGVGGVGKTRLAVETAAGVADRYADGVWLFEFATAADEIGVLSALTAAFGIAAKDPGRPRVVTEQISDHLSARQVLLLFDNCEHVIDPVARLVQTLLASCPDLRILATSRELLRLPGETSFPVPPLTLPSIGSADLTDLIACDAVALFCDRARDARAEFRLTDHTAPAVVRICRRLDGIPLALELAAARLRMLSVNQIADRLDRCFSLLGDARAAVPRQQTLRATLDWSYDLLSRAEQAALRQLAVFPDRFGLDAAVAVLDEDTSEVGSATRVDPFELVCRLVDRSLLVADCSGDQARYRLLEPIRQYAEEKLSESGETDKARGRHRDIYLTETFTWPTRLNIGPQLLADHANYLAALEWSWEQGDIDAALRLVVHNVAARLQSRDVEARQWLERVLAAPEPADHPARAQALCVLAWLVEESGQPDPGRAGQLMGDALAMARRLRAPDVTAWVQFYAGELQLAWGRSGPARVLLDAALGVFERVGATVSVGWCHEHLGWAAVLDHDFGRARAHFERARHLAGVGGDGEWLAAHASAALAPLTALLGDPERALTLAEETIAAARGFAIPSVLVMALARAGETAILAGMHGRAAEAVNELFGLLRDQATRPWVADALEMAALVLETGDDVEAATAALQSAEAVRSASGGSAGGTRALADAVHHAHDRLLGAGPAPAGADHSNSTLSVDVAISRAAAGLEALSGAGS